MCLNKIEHSICHTDANINFEDIDRCKQIVKMVEEKKGRGVSVVAPREKMQLGKLGPSTRINQIQICRTIVYKIVQILKGSSYVYA